MEIIEFIILAGTLAFLYVLGKVFLKYMNKKQKQLDKRLEAIK